MISVIIPVYNGEKYLAQAIESAIAQMSQSLEILIIDDGSTDNSANIAQQYAPLVNYHYQSNQGTAAARNYGMKLAQGDLFAFLDADDLWLPDKLNHQLAALADNPAVEAVFTHACNTANPTQIDVLTAIPAYLPSTMLINRAAMARVGEFSPIFSVAEWGDWYMRAQTANLVTLMLPNLLAIRRIHAENKSITCEKQGMTEYISLLKNKLNSARAAAGN